MDLDGLAVDEVLRRVFLHSSYLNITLLNMGCQIHKICPGGQREPAGHGPGLSSKRADEAEYEVVEQLYILSLKVSSPVSSCVSTL